MDLNTLLYVCIAAALCAAGVLSLFGVTQDTHRGFRLWVCAQWLVAAGLLLQALFGAQSAVAPLVEILVLQWPIVVLIGMRRLNQRKRPAVPQAVDLGLLALAAGLVALAWTSDVDSSRRMAAFALAAFGVNLYGAAMVSRLDGFQQSFALKWLAAMQCAIAALEAACGAVASIDSIGVQTMAAVHLCAHVAIAAAVLALVPIALALTYERTVAKMRAMHRKLRHLADIDALTRLPNRRHFHELAARSLATTEPAGAVVLMFDIENLKRINDLLGQATGDEALRQVGLALRETLRTRDVVGRLGGDEFAALLPNTTVADAVRVAARVTDKLESRQIAPHMARLTLNVGAVQMRASETVVEALRRADLALDDARNHRHDRPVSVNSLDGAVGLGPTGNFEPKPV
ncbi:MAG: GGDEF domain-containing protein [Caldimonas sp.]